MKVKKHKSLDIQTTYPSQEKSTFEDSRSCQKSTHLVKNNKYHTSEIDFSQPTFNFSVNKGVMLKKGLWNVYL